ncbi:MAG: aminoacyl-histidine dipeptidase [Mangrovibacterium sp.]
MLENLKPQEVWQYFEEIAQVPRPSKKEGQIRAYLLDFAVKKQLEAFTDEIGNVLIKKPASEGSENAKTVILQSHMDMVCEKNSDIAFNFDTDAIELVLEGEWLKANGTTLGADNGIGMAASLAVLASSEITHGPIECLFTVDEETGLSGAFALQEGFISGEILLNLDSEDDGEIFVGCAGGIDTLAKLPIELEGVPVGSFALQFEVGGLVGGHSGDDINKERGNANKILARFLKQAANEFELRVVDFQGGNLRNAIAREARAVVVIPQSKKEHVVAEFNIFAADLAEEYQYTDSGIQFKHQSLTLPEVVLTKPSQEQMLNLILACPHGVLAMSSRMPGMVETSTNLASVKINGDLVQFTTSQRSEVESRKYAAAQMVRAVFELAGAEVEHSEGYPGWTPNPKSYIVQVAADCYENLFGERPAVKSIHAGLECGLFLQKYPYLDMVSIGPTIRNPHSPDERIHLQHTEKFWLHLIDILKKIARDSK